jgi:hypothetical protein
LATAELQRFFLLRVSQAARLRASDTVEFCDGGVDGLLAAAIGLSIAYCKSFADAT